MVNTTGFYSKIKILTNNEEPEHLIEGVHEGIVTEELFDKVQDILQGKLKSRNRPKYNTLRPELFLRGNLICSECGHNLTGSPSRGKSGTKYFYYHCNHCGKQRYRAETVNDTINHIISELTFTSEAEEVYLRMMKLLMIGSESERNKKLSGLEKELEKQKQKLFKLQDLYLEGGLSKEDYYSMRNRYTEEKNSTEYKISEIKNNKIGLKKSLEKGVKVQVDIGKTYNTADLPDKRKIISSIFPENLEFDGEKCRTPRINEVLRLILLINNNKINKKSGQFSELLDVSAKVNLEGVEPPTFWSVARCSIH